MKILDATNNINARMNFRSSSREYFDENLKYKNYTVGQILTCTALFRGPLDWVSFANLLQIDFQDKDFVQCYSLGCSDGSEAYSLAIALDYVGEDLDKYSILAVDRDFELVNAAKKRRINLEKGDFSVLRERIKNYKEYFINEGIAVDIPNEMYVGEYHSYEPIDELKKVVNFEQNDLIRTIRKIKDDGNSVVLMRNVLPYIAKNRHEEIFHTLKKVLKKGSFLVIGDYDSYTKFADLLNHHTFCKKDFELIGDHIFRRL